MIRVSSTIAIPDRDVKERFTRAMGPGGQNARSEKTAVQLRYDVARSSLPPEVKLRLIALAGRHLDASGMLVIKSRASGSQVENRGTARDRLLALLQRAARITPAGRRPRPPRVEKEARLKAKHLRGSTKQLRSRSQED